MSLNNLIRSHKFDVKVYVEDIQILIINTSHYLDSNNISRCTRWGRCPWILNFSRSKIDYFAF